MAKMTLRHTKQLSKLELKRGTRSLKRSDPEESLRERIRQLHRFEKKFGTSPVAFYQKYRAGRMSDSAEVMRWAAAYEAYLSLMQTAFLTKAPALLGP
jgi:hypothetical protein